MIVQGKLDYSDPEVQRKVEALLQTFENSTYIEDRFYTESWLRDWVNFVDTSADLLDLNTSTPELWLGAYKSVREGGRAVGEGWVAGWKLCWINYTFFDGKGCVVEPVIDCIRNKDYEPLTRAISHLSSMRD